MNTHSDLVYDALILQEVFRHLNGLPEDIQILHSDKTIEHAIHKIETELETKYKQGNNMLSSSK